MEWARTNVPGAADAPDDARIASHRAHQQHVHQPDAKQPDDQPGVDRAGIGRARAARRRGAFGLAAQHFEYRASSRQHAGIEIAAAELRQDIALDDETGFGVGQLSLQTVADLDPDLAFLRRYNE